MIQYENLLILLHWLTINYEFFPTQHRKYGLALTKELLGIIRSKYASLPIPGAETTLDGDALRSEAAAEKEALVTQLREMLDQMSRKALLEADKDEAEFLNEKLNKVPIPIFIG